MNRHMYILADGGRIAASGPSEFVRLLREGSWFDSGCTCPVLKKVYRKE